MDSQSLPAVNTVAPALPMWRSPLLRSLIRIRSRGRAGAAAADSSTSGSTTAPATTVLKTGKSESGIAEIKRLDANMGAMVARIEDHIAQFHEHVAESFAADAGASSGFTPKDILEHPTIRALVASNNAVGTTDALRAEVTSLTSAIANMRGDDRKRKHDDDTSMYSEDDLLPAVKRVARASDISTTVASAQNGIPPPISHVELTATTVPGSVPDAPPRSRPSRPLEPSTSGPSIGTRTFRARCAASWRASVPEQLFVTAYFPTNVATIQFVIAWEAASHPAGYEKTSVSFASGN
ncbi:hypothetical protein B0H19DRAFT_1268453 [Mycena capillaripes]|nr:hypothetical protein B0H19DRAFT_1268453 [Mycena capillaripes]